MEISMIPAKALTSDLEEKWSLLQQTDDDFASPFFCPEFTSSLALYRNDIYVALMKEGSEVVGFFPFRLGRYAIAKPMQMCDYQGIIVKKGVEWNVEDVLKGCGLVAWDFDQLIASQIMLTKANNFTRTVSRTINLREGYDVYITGLQKSSPKWINNIFRNIRKFEREVGTINFRQDISDISILHKLLEWKAQKYTRSGKFEAWVTQTLETIFAIRKRNFRGVLSALYAKEELVAAHFGMCSGKILHWWFPAYNQAYEKYSPGIILLLKVADAFSSLGVEVIDFGPGEEGYKTHFSNDVIHIGQGSFEISSLPTLARKSFRKMKIFIRKSPYLYIIAKKVYGLLRRAAVGI